MHFVHNLLALLLSTVLIGCSGSSDSSPGETPANAGGGVGFGVGASRPASQETPQTTVDAADGSTDIAGLEQSDTGTETGTDTSTDDEVDAPENGESELADDDIDAENSTTDETNPDTTTETDTDGDELDELPEDADDSGIPDDDGIDPAIVGLWDYLAIREGLRDEAWLEIDASGQFRVFEYLGDEFAMNAGTSQNCYQVFAWTLEPQGESLYDLRFNGEDRSEDAENVELTATDNTLTLRFEQGSDVVVNSVPRATGLSSTDFNRCSE